MKKSTLFFLCSTMLLLGTILGFMFAPVKDGFFIGSNNGNSYGGDSIGNGSVGGGKCDDKEDIPF